MGWMLRASGFILYSPNRCSLLTEDLTKLAAKWIFSLHTKCTANVCVKFAQRVKFSALSVGPEKDKGQVEMQVRQ